MTSSSKRKGDNGEREVETLLRDLLGIPEIRRELGAGRADDRGDIHGVPDTVIQVAWREDIVTAIREKLIGVERQRKNARARFSAVFLRRSRSPWVVVMSPEMYAKMWKLAQRAVTSKQ